MALAEGGHLRVDMEDVLTLTKGVPVAANRQLVERAVSLGGAVGRRPATTSELCPYLTGAE